MWLLKPRVRLFLLFLPCLLPALGQAQVGEYEVKAAFLLNFTKFVEWPPSAFTAADDPIRLCVLGVDSFDGGLERLVQGKTVNGRSFRVEHPQENGDAIGCHLVFISATEDPRSGLWLRGSRPVGTLTVGESEDFARNGGVINFVLQQTHVVFEINPEAGQRAGLKISSKLLSLARIVHDDLGKK